MPTKGSSLMESVRIRRGMFLLLLFTVTVMFFGLIWEFLMACFWACIFAILFKGVYEWLVEKTHGRKNLAAVTTSLLILFAVVVPIALISIAVVNESAGLYDRIEKGDLDPSAVLTQLEQRMPKLSGMLTDFGVDLNKLYERAEAQFSKAISLIGKSMWRYTQNVIGAIVDFVLMLYLLFFLVRDGDSIVQAIRNSLPMGDRLEDILFRRFVQVARATLKGTVIVAVCQGTIGGVLFAILGIPAAVLWGVLMCLLSLLPVGGSGIVWAPTAVIMFVQGNIGAGIAIVVVGFLGIGLIDNLLRPLLVGRETKMPDFLVLVATLGGLAWFGLSGFIIGPVIAALFVTCWEITGQLFGGRDN